MSLQKLNKKYGDRSSSSQTHPGDYAPLSFRVFAYVVDIIAFYAITFALLLLLAPLQLAFFFTIISLPFWAVYSILFFAFQEAINGKTVGKIFCGIRVRSANGGKANIAQVLVRNFTKVLPFAPLVGFFAIMGSKDNQRIGDMLARTVVVRG